MADEQFLIEHERPGCIGCGACTAVCPQFWEMAADGKSDLKDAERIEENGEIIREQLTVTDLNGHKEAADACPVNVIHVTNKTTSEKLI
ncbi:MAG: ferredoxin [Nanoarchaeota archaeon]|nr:ferredoxin [Nanoarchaeota archaeon]